MNKFWLLVFGGLLLWGLGLSLFWRKRWMDRLLALDDPSLVGAELGSTNGLNRKI